MRQKKKVKLLQKYWVIAIHMFGERAISVQPVAAALPPVGDAEKRQNGVFSRKLVEGSFAVSVEVVPPRGTDPKAVQTKLDFIRRLAESGLADAVDVTDGSTFCSSRVTSAGL